MRAKIVNVEGFWTYLASVPIRNSTGDVRIEVFQPKGQLMGIEALGVASEPGSLKLFDMR
jgi:hypothetical protein